MRSGQDILPIRFLPAPFSNGRNSLSWERMDGVDEEKYPSEAWLKRCLRKPPALF